MIDLSTNCNPYGPAPAVRRALLRGAALSAAYSARDAAALREKIAAREGISPTQVVCGNGSSELIDILIRMLAPGEALALARPSFILYRMCAALSGRAVVDVPARDFAVDLAAVEEACRADEVKLIILANPNNPTGTFFLPVEIEKFLAAVRPDVTVAIDEAYIDYVDIRGASCARLLVRHENLIVLRTFSKIHGLAGARVGYALGAPARVAAMQRFCLPFNVSVAAQHGALAALDAEREIAAGAVKNRRERGRLAAALTRLALEVVPSQANFLFVRFSVDAAPIARALAAVGIKVAPMADYGHPEALRVSIGRPRENDAFVRAVADVIGAERRTQNLTTAARAPSSAPYAGRLDRPPVSAS